jgi:hypothetical protein
MALRDKPTTETADHPEKGEVSGKKGEKCAKTGFARMTKPVKNGN